MKIKFAIIGGGLAGLCAAIRLAELGEEPLIIESGDYPAHKICGEFLSPECLVYLNNWNIHPIPINEAILRTSDSELVFPFPSAAGGMSHLELDPSLVKHALSCGVQLRTNSPVHSFQQKKHSNDLHLIQLPNDEIIEAANVIIAAGRFNTYSSPPVMRYRGFKAHFENENSEIDRLEMFSFSGAYLGLSPIENGKTNVACIAEADKIGSLDPQIFIRNLISQNSYLNSLLTPKKNLFNQWMTTAIPAFGVKETPNWLDCYFIGDAAMTIPPASGNGLSLAIFGGRLAAEYAVKQNYQEFKLIWTKRCSSQLFWAKMLHKLLLNPSYGKPVMLFSKYFPLISKKIFDLTRCSTSSCLSSLFSEVPNSF